MEGILLFGVSFIRGSTAVCFCAIEQVDLHYNLFLELLSALFLILKKLFIL